LDYRTKLEHRLRQGELDPMLEAHLAKYRKLVPGLALTIHLAGGGQGEVSATAVGKALKWAEYLETHAARVYDSCNIAATEAAHAIIAKIKKNDLKSHRPTLQHNTPVDALSVAGNALAIPFGSREVWRPKWSRLTDTDTVHAALQLLVDYDWLNSTKIETLGRTATVFAVNPKVLLT